MEKHAGKKLVWDWVLKNFLSLQSVVLCSDVYVINSCRWNLVAYRMKNVDYLSMHLGVFDPSSLPCGWKRGLKLRIRVVNHISEQLSSVAESELWFDEKTPSRSFRAMLSVSKLYAKESGFLPNGDLMIVAELDAIEASVVTVKSEPLSKVDGVKSNSVLLEKHQQQSETKDVYGYQVLSSKVEFVKRIFERHPFIATQVRPMNQHLRTMYINVLMGLIEMLCQSTQEISDDDLSQASVALSCVAKAGYKVDWLEKKLNKVLEKKKRVKTAEAQLLEMEKELLKLNRKCSDLKALVNRKKAEVAEAKLPLSFDDVV